MRRGLLALSALAVVAAWGVCVASYATDGGGSYNEGVFTAFFLLAVALTAGAAISILLAWKGESSTIVAGAVSIPAVAAVLWLALALRLRG